MARIRANTWGGLTTGTFGDDEITGSATNDVINGLNGRDTINAGNGNDVVQGGVGADIMDGGDGNDTLSYASSGSGVFISLQNHLASGGDADGDTFANFENILGSKGNDILVGDGGANTISGNDGDDIILGGGGNDTLDGGAGNDTLSMFDSVFGATVDLAAGTARNEGGTDAISNFENVVGSNSVFGDRLSGNSAANILDGQDGNDRLDGRGGNDILRGGQGNDVLIGGDGHDRLEGGAGNDGLQGGAGRDTFVFARVESNPDGETNNDVVIDFQDGIDTLEIRGASFSMLNFATNSDGDAVITVDGSDLQITMHNVAVASLSASDFSFV